MASENIVNLTDATFEDGVKNGLVLVDFWAEWCGPCKALSPALESMADEFNQLTVAKVDVDSNPGVPGRFGIRGIPTVILFKDGTEVDKFVGNSPEQIREMVRRQL